MVVATEHDASWLRLLSRGMRQVMPKGRALVKGRQALPHIRGLSLPGQRVTQRKRTRSSLYAAVGLKAIIQTRR